MKCKECKNQYGIIKTIKSDDEIIWCPYCGVKV